MRFVSSDKLLLPCLAMILAMSFGCSMGRNDSTAENRPQTSQANSSTTETPRSESEAPRTGALNPGEASGSFTSKGETVQLRYAYAGRGKRFGEDSVIVLVTDQPIPADSIASELESQSLLLDEKIRGLEYVFSDNGFWVRFHPGQYQESKSGTIKGYVVGKGQVIGTDEDDGSMTDGKYSRSVSFVAALP
jgi:hypothetical protein